MPLIGRRIAAFAAVALIAAGVLSGCVGQDPKPASTPKASATPLYPSEKEALAAAKVAYAKYVEVSNQVAQGGWTDLTPLNTVATGNALKADTSDGRKAANRGLYVSGKAVGSVRSVQQLTNEAVVTYTCVDYSMTRVLDMNGVDQTSPNRAVVVPYQVAFSVANGQLLVEKSEIWSGKSFCS